MKIALIGTGKMGRMVEACALQKNYQIVARISRHGSCQEITSDSIRQADVCIDFTHPSCVVEHIRILSRLGKNVVVGTTGWYDRLDEVKDFVASSDMGLLYSHNFSLGVHLFLEVVQAAAKLFVPHSQYDVGITEAHHRQKADSPSGTAKAIAKEILDTYPHKTTVATEKNNTKIGEHELSISSVRCGSIPGTHSVIFDSPMDSITVTHEARNREGFAAGAVMAAEWLKGKKGLYTMQDIFRT